MTTAAQREAAREEAIPIDWIQIHDRHRADLGDIAGLAESIADIGLINPVTVTPDYRLIAGARRVAAYRHLGRRDIQARITDQFEDAISALRAERDENEFRKETTASEKVSLGLALEELERPKARERQAEGGKEGAAVTNTGFRSGDRKPVDGRGETRHIVAAAVGLSPSSYERAKRVVVAAADDTQPKEVQEAAKEALKEMDAGGPIRTASEKVKKAKEKATNPRPPAPPKFGGNRRKHFGQLEALVTGLSGYMVALAEIEESGLDGSVSSEEAARLTSDLSLSIRALNRINTLLKERIA